MKIKKKSGGAQKQMTNFLACGALGCLLPHLAGASATQACATGTCAALSSAKARHIIDYVFGNTNVVDPQGRKFPNKIEYYKSLAHHPKDRIEILSLMTPDEFNYLTSYSQMVDGQPEYKALTHIPTHYKSSCDLNQLLEKAKEMINDPVMEKFEWRLCPCEKRLADCPKSMETPGNYVLRFVPINDKWRNPELTSGWGFPYDTDKTMDTLQNSKYNPPEAHQIYFYQVPWREVTGMFPPGARFGGSYFNKKKFSKKNRIKKKKKSKKN